MAFGKGPKPETIQTKKNSSIEKRRTVIVCRLPTHAFKTMNIVKVFKRFSPRVTQYFNRILGKDQGSISQRVRISPNKD